VILDLWLNSGHKSKITAANGARVAVLGP